MLLALAFLLTALVLRAVRVSHARWSNMYEFNQAFATAVILVYLGLERRHPIRGLAPLAALVAAALLPPEQMVALLDELLGPPPASP